MASLTFRIGILLIGILLLGGGVASAAINTIPRGGDVFVGEQGLDISATGVTSGAQIGYFGTGGNVQSASPTATVTVPDAGNFYCAPADFSGMTGPWFSMPGRTLVFYVKEPQLTVRVIDISLDFEVAGSSSWLPKGDIAGFRIDNNLNTMTARGVTGAPVTIRIVSPDGTDYSSVPIGGGGFFSLVDIPVSSSTYSTGGVWYTGGVQSGTYKVWAECNANGMKDNYGQVGKAVSETKNILIQSVNPGIATLPVTTTKTAAIRTTAVATTLPTTTATTPVPPTSVSVPETTPATTLVPPTSVTVPETSPPSTPSPVPGFTAPLAAIALLAGAAVSLIAGRRR